MAAVQNIVELLFKVSDQATAPIKNLEQSVSKLEESSARVKSSFAGIGIAAAAVGGGLVYAVKKAVELGSTFEDTSLSIAGAISAFKLTPDIQSAEEAAVTALENIDRMAAKLPGTTQDYVEVFKQGLPAAIAAGVTNLDKIADFTSRYTAVATANMVDAQQAGSDLSLMLTGMAGQQVSMWRKLQPLIGGTAEQFNKMTREARMAAIDKSLAGYSGMLERAGNTMGAKLGEAEAHLVKIARIASQPIFTAVLDGLTKMNDYLEKNKGAVSAMGDAISKTLVGGVQTLIDNFDKLWKVVKNIGEIWVAFKAGVIAASVVDGIMAIVKAFGELRKMAVAAAAAEAFATGGISVAAGTLAAASVYAAFKMTESDLSAGIAAKKTAAEKAARLGDIDKMNKGVAELSQVLSDVTQGRYGKIGDIKYTEGKDAAVAALKAVGRSYVDLSEQGKAAFAAVAADVGVAVKDVAYMPKYGAVAAAKPLLPGGPKKAEVYIENARFDIKQAFAEGYDPDRIAAAFVDSIGSTTLFQGQSQIAAAGMAGA